MDFMTALDILLGLATVYLVFALGVTALNEGIAAMISSRAKWLERGIAALLSEDPKALNKAAAAKVMDSPYVTYLGTEGVSRTWRASYLPAWTLLQGVLSTTAGLKEDAFAAVATIRSAAELLPANSPARKVIVDLCARAGTDMAVFRKLLEEWFTTFEDQITAWYKQKTHLIVAALSVALALAMNIDTVAMVRQLSTDTKTRAALVEKALQTAKSDDLNKLLDTAARDKAKQAVADARSAESAAREAAAKASEDKAKADALKQASAQLDAAQSASAKEQAAVEKRAADMAQGLSSAGLQLGWQPDEPGRLWAAAFNDAAGFWAALTKLVGLLVSAAAISLGAPFWFNMLKTLASLRSVGPNTNEAAAQRAKAGG